MIHLKSDQPSDPLRSIVPRTNSLNAVLSTKTKRKSHSKQTAAMSQFWKPGAEKPRLLDDEEGGVVFLSSSLSSASSIGYQSHTKLCTQKHTFLYVFFLIRICICCFRYGYASIEKQRQRLPVYKYRTAILYLVETHATTIIVGETGSGKTTQIPQVFLFLISYLICFFIYFFSF